MQTKKMDSFYENVVTDGITIDNLPLKQISGNTKLKYRIDLAKVPSDIYIDRATILRSLQKQDLDSLPSMVKPQAHSIVPCDMQIVISKNQEGEQILLKHFQFSGHFETICVREPHFIDYGKQFRSGTLAFQWLLQKRYQTHFKSKATAKVKARKQGPRSNIHNRLK